MRKVRFKATFLSCRAAPPSNKGFNFAQLGKENNFDQRIIFRFNIRVKNATADIISADKVASAAPGTPIANVNMRIGSRIALNTFDAALIFNGVEVSKVPRKAENPIKLISEGKNANDLMKR